jgi:hypothetical protein
MTVLNYRGNAGLQDMSAFNARLQIMWKGDHLFRVYPVDGHLYFIHVAGSKQKNAAIGAQFGLIGAIWMHFAAKRQARKTQETLNNIAGADPLDLLSQHKLNFALPVEQVKSAEFTPRSFLDGATAGRCKMIEQSGKKRHISFDDTDNMRLAIDQLSPALGDRVKLKVQWDEAKRKYRKL